TADRYKFGFAEERVVGDWVEMLFYVPSLTWIAGWILSFAHHAEVLEPQALRDVLHQWAEALLQKYRPLVPEE
ncbi:MAG: WYL domain-containing protein, partial [Chlorobi bacterium CHB2]|nr:WYL domain-containing protein [Chlorobi bacterium CHB2]